MTLLELEKTITNHQLPITRPRRLRATPAIRAMPKSLRSIPPPPRSTSSNAILSGAPSLLKKRQN